MALSVTAITGLGGPELLERHAVETAEAFNAMNPEYIGMLTLMVEDGTPLQDWVREGKPPPPDPRPGPPGDQADGGDL